MGRCCFALTLILLLGPLLSRGQETAGSPLQGVLNDDAGHPVPGASVQLVSQSLHKTARTAEDGRFRFDDLTPGKFTLSVEWNGAKAILTQPFEFASTVALLRLTLSAQNVLSMAE